RADLDALGAGREVTQEGGTVETVGLGDPHGVEPRLFQFHDLVDRGLGLTLVLERHGDTHVFLSPPEARARPGSVPIIGTALYDRVPLGMWSGTHRADAGRARSRRRPTRTRRTAARRSPDGGSRGLGYVEKVCRSSWKVPPTTSAA